MPFGPIIETTPVHLEVVYKISERCNLACDYCYFFFRGDETYKDRPAIAPETTTENLASFLAKSVKTHNIKSIKIVLHGGEPMMMPKRKFRKLIDLLRSADLQEVPISFAAQTNAALITPEWIDVLQDCEVGCGVSFDGPPAIHDVHRIDHLGNGSYEDCRRGWDMLMEASKQGRVPQPGLLCVIDPFEDANVIFDHFVNELNASSMNFLIPDYNHEDELKEGYVQKLGQYMIKVFDKWSSLKDPNISIRFIQETLFPLAKTEALDGSTAGLQDIRNQITISSKGEIFPEDTVKVLPPYQTTDLNVSSHSASDVFNSHAWIDMQNALKVLPVDCESCEWKKICYGGRTNNRFSAEKGLSNPSVFCEGLKDYYEHITAALVSRGHDLNKIEKALIS